MTTIQIELDEETLARAERKAEELSTTVPNLLADYLSQLASREKAQEESHRQMKEMFANPQWEFGIGVPDTREERNARR